MTFFIQIFGLILNLYLVFLFTSRIGARKIELNTGKESKVASTQLNSKYWLSNIHNDQNRLELLNRISLLLLISYFIVELDFFLVSSPLGVEISLIDGSLKLTNTKSLINLGIFLITSV